MARADPVRHLYPINQLSPQSARHLSPRCPLSVISAVHLISTAVNIFVYMMPSMTFFIIFHSLFLSFLNRDMLCYIFLCHVSITALSYILIRRALRVFYPRFPPFRHFFSFRFFILKFTYLRPSV